MSDFFCEAETLCSVKLVNTKGKVEGSSGVDARLTSLFRLESESVDCVGRGVVGALEGPEGALHCPLFSFEYPVVDRQSVQEEMGKH